MRKWLALCVLLDGCAIRTTDIRAEFELHQEASKLTLRVYFYDDAMGHSVELDDARVTLAFRGRNVVAPITAFYAWAELELDAPISADEPLSITVARQDETPIVSEIALPEQLAVDPVPLFISRSRELTLAWQPITDDPMYWEVEGYCVNGRGEIPSGVGEVTIPADAIVIHETPKTCTGKFVIARYRQITVENAFANSDVYYVDRISTEFASTP